MFEQVCVVIVLVLGCVFAMVVGSYLMLRFYEIMINHFKIYKNLIVYYKNRTAIEKWKVDTGYKEKRYSEEEKQKFRDELNRRSGLYE